MAYERDEEPPILRGAGRVLGWLWVLAVIGLLAMLCAGDVP